ncbi:hypothetical protein [Spongiactinospora gelatinilytica]|nr:hypothetical protein [Spongiactinospora gelatinilytica]
MIRLLIALDQWLRASRWRVPAVTVTAAVAAVILALVLTKVLT